MTIRDRLYAVVRQYYALDETIELFPATTLTTFKFDESDVVFIGVDLEEEFALEIPLDMLADATTLGEIEAWLTEQLIIDPEKTATPDATGAAARSCADIADRQYRAGASATINTGNGRHPL